MDVLNLNSTINNIIIECEKNVLSGDGIIVSYTLLSAVVQPVISKDILYYNCITVA